ncbi:hypothetical protein [uncultured Helicobacter sp.]|uniref:hypothetical protein n=1 Tax=uncultured Helicobacter sp. TaxID=175537 RepID=UPI00261CEE3D|nr:hypothetical protein [uncultured Helicobacter sp.]
MQKDSLMQQMSKKGIKLRTWCKAMSLSDADYLIIKDISKGRIKGIRGKSKELRKLLEQSGFEVA